MHGVGGVTRARWAAQGCLRVGCAARPTNTLTEPIFAFSLSPESEKPLCAIAWPVGVRPLPPYTEAPNGASKDG